LHNAALFGVCIHILNTGCAKNLKENSGAKGLISQICGMKRHSLEWD
jgi:hypothetical protein